MKKIYFLNAMVDPQVGAVFSEGIHAAQKKHPRAGEFQIIEKNFFYGKSRVSPLDMHQVALEENVAGVILSGSEKNTSDPFDPWVKSYLQGLKKLIGLDRGAGDDWAGPAFPVFGICFGHQALAVALGGEVSRFSYQSGFIDLNLRRQSQNHPIFKKLGAESKLRVGVTHGDHVVRLPKGLHLLATSDYCDCQAFAHDQWDIVGVQCHPEITAKIQTVASEKKWKNESDEDFKDPSGSKILESVYDWMLRA